MTGKDHLEEAAYNILYVCMCMCVCPCMCACVQGFFCAAFCICTCACAFLCECVCLNVSVMCVCMYIVARGQKQVSSSTILHYDFVVVVFCFEAGSPTEPGFQRQAGLISQ